MELTGLKIEGYEILNKIGAGGMGMVYKAKDLKLDRFVALKLMSPSLQMELFERRFWKEARALAKLSDPYIVSIHTFLETELGLVIVMEYLDGVTLGEYMRRKRPMSASDSLRILKQLLRGIHHAHSENIIHRDIKPQNIIITAKDEIVKLTDFGLAKIYESGDTAYTSVTGGTLHYMSPEQVSGDDDVDARSDIYSIGITAYQMLAGSTPFPGDEKGFMIQSRIMEGNLVPLTVKNKNIPAPLVAIIMKALENRPERRFQTAKEFLEAIEQFEPGNLYTAETVNLSGGKAGPGLPDESGDVTEPTVGPVIIEASEPEPVVEAKRNIFFSRTFMTIYSVLIIILLAFSLQYSRMGKPEDSGVLDSGVGREEVRGSVEVGAGPEKDIQSADVRHSQIAMRLMSARSTDTLLDYLNEYRRKGEAEVGRREDFSNLEGLLVFVVDAETKTVLGGFRFEHQEFVDLKTTRSIRSLSEEYQEYRDKRAIWVKEL